MRNKIPICYHPTKVVFVEDNADYLIRLNLGCEKDFSSYLSFMDARKAVAYFQSEYNNSPFTDRITKEIDGEGWQHQAIDINLYGLPLEVYNRNRFEQVSCIITDYDMPGMSGIEMCQKIPSPLISKILLTATADDRAAIDAFNKGIIQGFLRKGDPDAFDKLNNMIEEARYNYFSQLSSTTLGIIFNNPQQLAGIKDRKFIEFFYNLIQKYNITEYYLFEAMGCFMLVDEQGKVYGLFTFDEDEVAAWEENARDSNCPLQLIEKYASREYVFCFHRAHDVGSDGEPFPAEKDRLPYLRRATKLKGELLNYYYAVTRDSLDINPSKILSFGKYKQMLEDEL